MKTKLNIDNWVRKDHFHFFSGFSEPFFGITVSLDCTHAFEYCKQHNYSFFLYYLHQSLVAANAVEPFRYRIIDGEVYIFDAIHASATVKRADHTFDFSYMEYSPDFGTFSEKGKTEITRIQNGHGLNPSVSGVDVIHYSSIPWLSFTSISHARNFAYPDSCPKISFGKLIEENDKKLMPVSIHVHHGLMDAYHVSKFYEAFQSLMNSTVE